MENIQLESVLQPSTSHGHNFLYVLQFTHKEKQFQLNITPENFSSKIIEPENIMEILQQAFQNGEKFEECLDVHGTIETETVDDDVTCTIMLSLTQRVTAKKTVSEELYFFPEIVSCTTSQRQELSNYELQNVVYKHLTNQHFQLRFDYKNKSYQTIIEPGIFQSKYIPIDKLGHLLQTKKIKFQDEQSFEGQVLIQELDSQTIVLDIEVMQNNKRSISTPVENIIMLCISNTQTISFQIDLQGQSYQQFITSTAKTIHSNFYPYDKQQCLTDLENYLKIHFSEHLETNTHLDNSITLRGDKTTFFTDLNKQIFHDLEILYKLILQQKNQSQLIELIKQQLKQNYGYHQKSTQMTLLLNYCYKNATKNTYKNLKSEKKATPQKIDNPHKINLREQTPLLPRIFLPEVPQNEPSPKRTKL